MKVVLNIFNLSTKPARLLHIFFDELSDLYNVEILTKTLLMNQFNFFCKISSYDLVRYKKRM